MACSHKLVPAFRFDDDVDYASTGALLDRLFMTFNVGHEPGYAAELPEALRLLACAYRQRKPRSLSVGDVIRIGPHY